MVIATTDPPSTRLRKIFRLLSCFPEEALKSFNFSEDWRGNFRITLKQATLSLPPATFDLSDIEFALAVTSALDFHPGYSTLYQDSPVASPLAVENAYESGFDSEGNWVTTEDFQVTQALRRETEQRRYLEKKSQG